jgi:uncharacterized membrane protein YdjX (TVP38/TMEM64 family)
VSRSRLAVALILAAALLAFIAAGVQQHLSFENIEAQQDALESWRRSYPWQTALGFFALFVVFTAASLPGAMLLTLLGGAVFGFGWGTLIASFGAALGSTIAFLGARFVFRDWVRARFGPRLEGIARGVADQRGFRLFTLRLIPGVPYFLINLAMAVSPIGVWTFYWVSQLAMLPSTVLYANAGTQLARLESPRDVLSWQLIGALVLLGLFPLAAKKALGFARSRSDGR